MCAQNDLHKAVVDYVRELRVLFLPSLILSRSFLFSFSRNELSSSSGCCAFIYLQNPRYVLSSYVLFYCHKCMANANETEHL